MYQCTLCSFFICSHCEENDNEETMVDHISQMHPSNQQAQKISIVKTMINFFFSYLNWVNKCLKFFYFNNKRCLFYFQL